MSHFAHLELLPDDPIFSLPIAFRADPRSHRVNLGVGTYKDAEGKAPVLKTVRKAEALMYEQKLTKRYLPIDGDPEFLECATKLVFGEERLKNLGSSLYSMQSIGGSGALRIGGELIDQKVGSGKIFVSDPTWPNHRLIFRRAGIFVEKYAYYDKKNQSLDFERMCESIQAMPEKSIVLLHGCCHNPTGVDPTKEQWIELSHLIKKNHLIPFFDLAYLGFKEGIEKDAFAVQHFADEGHEMLLAASFSKNFGLYGERVGFLSVLTGDQKAKERVASQCKNHIRGNYSNPPLHGARIVKTILSDDSLKKEWIEELSTMRERILEMRKALSAGLQAKSPKRNFQYITQQGGMFSFTGLDVDQVQTLKQEHAIYMPKSGRINIAGLNHHNLQHVIDAIVATLL